MSVSAGKCGDSSRSLFRRGRSLKPRTVVVFEEPNLLRADVAKETNVTFTQIRVGAANCCYLLRCRRHVSTMRYWVGALLYNN
jgi:hypothetical protein